MDALSIDARLAAEYASPGLDCRSDGYWPHHDKSPSDGNRAHVVVDDGRSFRRSQGRDEPAENRNILEFDVAGGLLCRPFWHGE